MTTTPHAATRTKPNLDPARARPLLRSFNFKPLFVEEMGWERHGQTLIVPIAGEEYRLDAVAQKRGMVVFVCSPGVDGVLPERKIRQKIHRQVAKSSQEHLIIFVDAARTAQVWQWVRREPGRADAYREVDYRTNQSGEALIQRLQGIAFSIYEEEQVALTDVTSRTKHSFDVDRVTKRFYERFKEEHKRFLAFIEGIPIADDRAWYASLMLNRLMFVYFIQKKGFLDGDRNYLRNRLSQVQAEHGAGRFHSFYRAFLLRLFHEGLGGTPPHAPELVALIGEIPYLNGGIFDIHQLEQRYPEIQIPDEAFDTIFDFFEQYQWHLDERPLRRDDEINPDVLGYIFEKYINQKEMGAYYTKEDITEYISKSSIIPFLFDVAERKCRVAFEGQPSVWDLLREEPDHYIYDAVKKGVDLPLPPEIAAGVGDVAQRGGWNRPAPAEYALPTEIWREVVARRRRYQEVRAKLAAGEIRSINDLITYNLDLHRLALDAIQYCEGPELLRAFYQAIKQVTILDPTCGSGAFLFAALNILEPLYDACLERMEAFIADAERLESQSRRYSDFRKILADVDKHPNRRYSILKSIVVNNLYGVDIMEEAVEICKLRLFLKLVAQVDDAARIEPLPDIDFNVRAGNTLVGFASRDEVSKAVNVGKDKQLGYAFLDDLDRMAQIDEDARIIAREFAMFQNQQTTSGGEITAADKQALRARLDALAAKLDRYLAAEYGIDNKNIPDAAEYELRFAAWKESHKPFHWFAEFYGIMQAGGFDVIIGNPPWIEYARTKKDYTVKNYVTLSCGNLYGLCIERARALRSPDGSLSFIVQLPLMNSSRMEPVRELLRKRSDDLWLAPFDDRPGKLFEGLQNCRSVIFTSRSSGLRASCRLYSTRYQRWSSSVRATLIASLAYTRVLCEPIVDGHFPKYASTDEERLFQRVRAKGTRMLATFASPASTDQFVFYQESTRYWVNATLGLPYYSKNGVVGAPAHGRFLYFRSECQAAVTCALLNSSLFYVYFIAYGDCFHLTDGVVSGFPVTSDLLSDSNLAQLGASLMQDLEANATEATISTKTGDRVVYAEFVGAKSKPIIDEIDRVLARHYGFTDEELDFIINYDIKYRMGRDAGSDGE